MDRVGWYWWLNGSHCTNDSSFSPSQSTFHFSSRRSSSARCGDSFNADSWVLLSSAWEQYCYEIQRKRCSLFLKADDRKILELLVLLFCGFVELIRRTTMMCAPCRGLHTDVGSSFSLPSSIPHGIVLSVTTSDWFLCLSRAAESKHLKWCDVPILDKPLSTRYEKVSDIIYMSRMAGRAAQQHVLVGYLEIGQMVTTLRSSIPDHKLNTKFWPPLYQTRALQRNCRQSPCSLAARASSLRRTRPTTATNPCSHHVELERQRSPLRSAQRRRATELCPHRPASRSSTLYLSVTWDEQQRAYRRRTQYERKHTSHGLCRKRQTAVAPSELLFVSAYFVPPVALRAFLPAKGLTTLCSLKFSKHTSMYPFLSSTS